MKKWNAVFLVSLCSAIFLFGGIKVTSNKLLLDDASHVSTPSSVQVLKVKKNWEKKIEEKIDKYIGKNDKGRTILIGCGITAAIMLLVFLRKKE